MTSIREVLAKPFFETKGVGNAIFDDGNTMSVNFKIEVFSNGTITGNLKFQSPDPKIWQLFEGISFFTLKGKSDPNKEDIIATRCLITSISDFSEGKFSAFKVIVNPQILKTKPTTKLLFKFSLINVRQTFRVVVDTEIGELWLAHHPDINELEQIMKLHRMSLVTSTAEISTQVDGSKSLDAIVDKTTEIVQNFLKITSLAQTSWHDWAWLQVYEKTDASDEYQRIFLTFSSPKRKPPISRGITNLAHSAHFFEAAWKGFSPLLNEKYGFDVALEWYIESNLATVAESQFICATTCLEMLMDKFHSQRGTEFLLEKEMFDEFYDAIKNYSRDWLKDRKISKETRAAIYRAMLGLNRKQYVDKMKELLVHLGVEYSDVGITLEEIIDVRDQITHRGIYYETDEKGFQMVFKAYEGLFSILTRIFLAMLKYNEQYYDPTKQKWLRFAEVCNKI